MKREGVTHTEGGEEAALRNTARAAEVFMPGYVCIAVPNGHAQKKKKKNLPDVIIIQKGIIVQ